MIRIIVIGLWICAVALGSLFLAVNRDVSASAAVEAGPGGFGGVDYVKTDVMSVPIISNGAVTGYVVAQLVYTVDSNIHKKLTVPLEYFISDEIFHKFYGSYSDAKSVEKVSFEDVRSSIINDLNARFPEPVIKDLLVEQFNYISSEEIRTMNMRAHAQPGGRNRKADAEPAAQSE
ncbi:hypothetical protein [Brucella melitensis]|uniref:hypothetical protein n=1 Tax=Brucella melitensis TaxID=29459 RepID=UPI0002D13F23|nr:hypothetical protein [Brucella melitensis]ENS91215.1 hypothetical protein C033_02930 [Brucella melitensis UK37/05]